MDGQFQMNKKTINLSLNKWLKSISDNSLNWEKSGLYLDEIMSLEIIERKDWVPVSLIVYKMLVETQESVEPLIPFLHLPLTYSRKLEIIDTINSDWLYKNIDSITPPSFHFTDVSYFNTFYMKELQQCQLDQAFIEEFQKLLPLQMHFRIFFDKKERAFSREIYVFSKL